MAISFMEWLISELLAPKKLNWFLDVMKSEHRFPTYLTTEENLVGGWRFKLIRLKKARAIAGLISETLVVQPRGCGGRCGGCCR
jgi:hypothetical protein